MFKVCSKVNKSIINKNEKSENIVRILLDFYIKI